MTPASASTAVSTFGDEAATAPPYSPAVLRQLASYRRRVRRPGPCILAVSTASDPPVTPVTKPSVRLLATWLTSVVNEPSSPLPVLVQLDSGSSVTVISSDLFATITDKSELTPPPFRLQTASGSPLPVLGCSTIKLAVGKTVLPVCVFVAKSLAMPFILGLDFFTDFRIVLDFDQMKVLQRTDEGLRSLGPILSGSPQRFHRPMRRLCASAVVAENTESELSRISPAACYSGPLLAYPGRVVRIRPRTVQLVHFRVWPKIESECVFVPDRSLTRGSTLVLASAAVSPDTIAIPVCNMGYRPVTIQPHTCLGRLFPLRQSADPALVSSVTSRPDDTPPEPVQFNVNPAMDPEERRLLLALLHAFRDCFALSNKELKIANVPEVEIALKNLKIVRSRQYRLSKAEREALREQLNEFLELKIIEPSTSPYSSPICFVRKSNGSFRMIMDLRKINKQIAEVSWPIPKVDEILDKFAGARYLASIDLKVAFQQIPLKDGLSKDIFSFECEFGKFKFATLPQGMKNSPFYLALAMYRAYAPLLHPGTAHLPKGAQLSKNSSNFSMYFDDCNFHSRNFQAFYDTIHEFLQLTRAAGVTLSAEKSMFGYEEMRVLGFMVSGTKIRMPETAVTAIQSFKEPSNVGQLQSLLGICNFYRRFVRSYARKAAPLYALLVKDARFHMGPDQKAALELIKTELSKNIPLVLFDDSRETALFCDASRVGLGATCAQKVGNTWQPVYCASRSLHGSEKRYSPTELELLACCFGVKQFRHYFLGRHFTIFSDHKALSYIDSLTTSNQRLAKFMLYLSPFDYKIVYFPGKDQVVADALSRLTTVPAPGRSFEEEDADAAVLAVTRSGVDTAAVAADDEADDVILDAAPPCLPDPVLSLPQGLQIPAGTTAAEYVRAQQRSDPDLAEVITALESGDNGFRPARRFQLRHGLLHTRSGQLVIPPAVRPSILSAYHSAGHYSVEKTLQSIRQRYDWPTIRSDVQRHCATCHACQLKKVTKPRNPSQLNPLVSHDCFDLVVGDFLGPLPGSHGKHYILVFVDTFTKYCLCYATTANAASDAIRCFNIMAYTYGLPKRFYSDAHPFSSAEFSEHLSAAGVQQNIAPPNTHFCVGAAEGAVRRIKNQLHFMANEEGSNWFPCLPKVTFVLNNSVMPEIKVSPFVALHGFVPRLSIDNLLAPVRSIQLETKMRQLADNREQLRVDLLNYRTRMKRHYDAQHQRVEFQPGDKVKLFHPGSPFGWKRGGFSGPHKVLRKLNDQTYLVRYPVRGRLEDKPVHAWNLEPYYEA